jgi:hypothetical protein
LLCDPFRLSLSSGNSIGTLVLAGCLFLIATHRVLVRADRTGMLLLGAAGALAILAEPTWWPGVLAAVVLLAAREAPKDAIRSSLGFALVTLVLLSLPGRAIAAHEFDGDLTGDLAARATQARNAEFPGRTGTVGLAGYVFGDHSIGEVAGGTLSGAHDGLTAFARRPETKLVGLLVFLVELGGAAFVLLLPRLRLLVVIPAMVALVPWFFTGRDALDPLVAGSAFWPALLVGAAAVAYAGLGALRARHGSAPIAGALPGRVREAASRIAPGIQPPPR